MDVETEVTDQPTAEETVPATGASDNPSITETVDNLLADFNNENPDDSETVESTPEEDEGAAEETTEEEESPEVESTPEEEAVEETSEPTLPDVYRRSAKAAGWTDEDIDRISVNEPELAIKMFEKMHNDRNALTNHYAEIGRKLNEQVVQPTDEAIASQQKPMGEVKPIDMKSLADAFSDEEKLETLVGSINSMIEQQSVLVQQANQAQEYAKQAEQDNLAEAIDSFFVGDGMKQFEEFYSDRNLANPESNYVKAVTLAGDIIAGATQRGVSMGVDEALLAAHDVVAADFKQEATKTQIRKDVTKRSKGITLKPTSREGKPNGAADDRAALERVVSEGLAAL